MEEQFPGSRDSFLALRSLVATFRAEQSIDPSGLELELRFGTCDVDSTGNRNTRYMSQISETAYTRALRLVCSNPDLIHASPYEHLVDTFYDVSKSGSHTNDNGAQEVRVRSVYDTDEMSVKAVKIQKKKISECFLRCEQYGSVRPFIRAVVSREVQPDSARREGLMSQEAHHTRAKRAKLAPTSCLPNLKFVTPKHVRLQERRRCCFHSRATDKESATSPHPRRDYTWAIDFSCVWSGSTRSEAERSQQQGSAPQRAMELELIDPQYVVRHDDAYVACSLAQKASDLIQLAHGNDDDLILDPKRVRFDTDV